MNAKPLLYGIEHGPMKSEIELSVDYPANLANQLMQGSIDVALLPVAAMLTISNARIIADYGIAADGEVASVAIFSQVPVNEIKTVYLDYQSRTSVMLAKLLMRDFWQQEVKYQPASEHYIEYINGHNAGVIIGDRALIQLHNFEYVYDLAAAWKEHTGLPFVFAAWVANKDLPTEFMQKFNDVNAEGLGHMDEIASSLSFPYYDLKQYYRQNIQYHLDAEKRKGLDLFLKKIQTL